MFNRIFCLAFFTIGLAWQSSVAQVASVRRAEALMKLFAYQDAADLFERITSRHPEDTASLRKLTLCYLKLNKPDNAVVCYEAMLKNNMATGKDFYEYAECLQQVGKYKEAQKWHEQSLKSPDGDKRSAAKLKSFAMLDDFYKDSSYYIVSSFPFNTEDNDFAPVASTKGILFVTSGLQKSFIKSDSPWTNEAFFDLFFASRKNPGDTVFSVPYPFSESVNSKYHEGPGVFSKDESTLIFTRSNYFEGKTIKSVDKQNNLSLFIAANSAEGWGNVKIHPLSNANYSVCHPAMNSDSNVLVFSSDMPGGVGGLDLYISTLVDGKWSAPKNLGPEINTTGNETFSFLYKDSLLFFASNGLPGLGGLDIYVSEWKNNTPSVPRNIGYPINSPRDDFGLVYDGLSKRGFFSSNRPHGMGGDDIYQFIDRVPGPVFSVTVIDENNHVPISDVDITLFDELHNPIFSGRTSSIGKIRFPVRKAKKYFLEANNSSYFPQSIEISTTNVLAAVTDIEIMMFNNSGFNLIGSITDLQSGKSLDDVHVVVRDKDNNQVLFDSKSDAQGAFSCLLKQFKLNHVLNAEIKLEKKDYAPKTLTFISNLERSGDFRVNDKVDLRLDKLKLGIDIGKLVDLKTIYFDLGKAVIRPDAAIELDKVVKILGENPNWKIEVGSHTDSRGSATANQTLSGKRAKSTADYIVSKGINRERISFKGYGEKKLINRCKDGVKCSDEEHQQNRRTEFKITGM